MGSSQSILNPQALLVCAVGAGALGLGYAQLSRTTSNEVPNAAPTPASVTVSKKGKKRKKSTSASQLSPDTVDASSSISVPQRPPNVDLVPGAFDAEEGSSIPIQGRETPSKPSKGKKKKKTKSPEAAADGPNHPTVDTPEPPPSQQAAVATSHELSSTKPKSRVKQKPKPSASNDTDRSWTRVEGGRLKRPADATTTDAEITTQTFTTNSSPTAERTEDEFLHRSGALNGDTLPLDDVSSASFGHAAPDLSSTRTQHRDSQKLAAQVSRTDNEDLTVAESTGGGNDADEEDSEGWDVVTNRKRSKAHRPTPLSEFPSPAPSQAQSSKASSSSLTQRQRQNARRRDALKTAKAEAEAERLAALTKHKKALEGSRIMEQFTKSGGKTPSGGMKATVDERGKLVWE